MLKEDDKLATRLAMILTKFNLGERLYVTKLAEEFNVNIRTIVHKTHKNGYMKLRGWH